MNNIVDKILKENNFKPEKWENNFDYFEKIPEDELIKYSELFDKLIYDKKMYHDTPYKNIKKIKENGLTSEYNYFSIDILNNKKPNKYKDTGNYLRSSICVLCKNYINYITPDPEGLPDKIMGILKDYLNRNYELHDYKKEWLKWIWIKGLNSKKYKKEFKNLIYGELKEFGLWCYVEKK